MTYHEYVQYVAEHASHVDRVQLETVLTVLAHAYQEGKTLFLIGNGGSAANASHFAQDLAKGTLHSPDQTPRLRALSLTDNVSYISALANDEGYDRIFEQQLATLASPGDVLIAISGAGNSRNVLRAVEWAEQHELMTIGFAGFDGGKLKTMVRHCVHVPLHDMCATEAVHAILFHYITEQMKERTAR